MNLFTSENLSGKEFYEESLEEAGDYVGEWDEGLRDGVGRNVWPNGDIYEGQWSQDMQNGWGQNIWSDGSKYIGYYLNNLKSGEESITGKMGASLPENEWIMKYMELDCINGKMENGILAGEMKD
eukprot:CAMPEP_0168315762 /NCGR_PEP_ID=MMETSP0210-20121227/12614_1 /TAXON_ID=40633 /ORGANISM="Condylostoma magnum, Strain COL2" /LENGTH=124 /DNA_ID=CAMNT_0008291341 /DNA_START=685 /DNA_END=1060 /DNA_ORIENTATION=-